MKKIKIYDENMPQGKLTRIPDFLPPPEELILPADTVKVTMCLSRSSVDFFKKKAREHKTKYQKMVRELLDRYVARYSRSE